MNDCSVSNEKGYFAGTEQQLRKRTPEEVRLQTATENRQRWCGRDVATIPADYI